MTSNIVLPAGVILLDYTKIQAGFDLVVQSTDGVILYLSRAHLAASSEYFHSMLNGTMRESRTVFTVDDPLQLNHTSEVLTWVMSFVQIDARRGLYLRRIDAAPVELSPELFLDIARALDEYRLMYLLNRTMGDTSNMLNELDSEGLLYASTVNYLVTGSEQSSVTMLNTLAALDAPQGLWDKVLETYFDEGIEKDNMISKFNLEVLKRLRLDPQGHDGLAYILSNADLGRFNDDELKTMFYNVMFSNDKKSLITPEERHKYASGAVKLLHGLLEIPPFVKDKEALRKVLGSFFNYYGDT